MPCNPDPFPREHFPSDCFHLKYNGFVKQRKGTFLPNFMDLYSKMEIESTREQSRPAAITGQTNYVFISRANLEITNNNYVIKTEIFKWLLVLYTPWTNVCALQVKPYKNKPPVMYRCTQERMHAASRLAAVVNRHSKAE